MKNTTGTNLPAYTTIDNILLFLDTLKVKKKDDEVKAIFGKGGSVYTNTKSAVRAFGFIENDSLEFTEAGRQIAYSPSHEKKLNLTKVFKICTPYEVFLLRLLKNGDMTVTTIDDIVNAWGQANYGSTERNRQDAAKLFMSIIQYVEFGKYVIGRGQNSTRIEWEPDIKEKISSIVAAEENESSLPFDTKNNTLQTDQQEKDAPPESALEKNKKPDENKSTEKEMYGCRSPHFRVSNHPNITLNVDMSNWSDEKMKTFFKYVYGQFDED